MIFAILLLPVCANATTIDFYNNGTITDDDVFDTVNIWDSANVTMTGGDVFWCYTHNTSTFTYYGGYGDLSVILMYDTSIVRNYADWTPTMELYGNSQMHIYNGHIGSSVSIYDDAQLHVYGYSLSFTYPEINGFWPDGQHFSFYIRNTGGEFNPDEQVFLHEIPEPTTLLLFGIGTFLLRKLH
jgi:hypothetical protein